MASVLSRRTSTIPAQAKGYPLALWALWAFLIVAVARLAEIVPGMGSVPLAKLAVAFCVFGLMMNREAWSAQKFLIFPLPRTALTLFLLSGASILVSVWLSATVSYFFSTALIVAIGFVLTLKLCNRRRELIATLFVLVVAALAQAVAALGSGHGRISAGESYDTNDLAYLLVTILPIALAFTLRASGLSKRILWILICLFLVVVILLTQSRGGFLGLMGVVALLIFRPFKTISATKKPRGGIGLFGRLSIVIVAGALVSVSLPGDAKARLMTLFSLESDYNTDVTLETGRLAIWTRNVKAALGRPVGFGLNTFGVVDMRTGGKFKAAHNSLIQVLVELGFLGLFLFLRVYWLAWRSLSRPRTDDADAAYFCQALQMALIGNFISGFFLSQAFSNLLWTLFAAITLCSLQFTEPTNKLPKPRNGLGRLRS